MSDVDILLLMYVPRLMGLVGVDGQGACCRDDLWPHAAIGWAPISAGSGAHLDKLVHVGLAGHTDELGRHVLHPTPDCLQHLHSR